ncbi:isochorismatase family protein [Amycolatopsis sp. cg5]|uniref:isochorismatase family protein n=1 Tax=Amycolatopsis sp. cg5 TaxID=3238802 RepID=UPI003523755C
MPGLPSIQPYPMPTENTLPANTADWVIDPARAVLLVHDLQRYFLKPLPEMLRKRMVANAALLREQADAAGMPVAYTAQPGDMTPQDRGLLKDFWGPGMRVDPADRQVVDELAPRPGDWMFTKWRYSAFFRSNLLERMRAEGRDQLVVCGVYAHVGVMMSAVDAYTNDIQPFLAADAVADFSEADHRLALDYVAKRCGMVVSTGQLVSRLAVTREWEFAA